MQHCNDTVRFIAYNLNLEHRHKSASNTEKKTSGQRIFDKRPHRGLVTPWPHIIHGSLNPRESGTNRHLKRFSRFCVHRSTDCPCFSVERPTLKLPLAFGGSGPHLMMILYDHPTQPPNGKTTDFAVFAGLTISDQHTDTQTDRPRYCVWSNNPHASYVTHAGCCPEIGTSKMIWTH